MSFGAVGDVRSDLVCRRLVNDLEERIRTGQLKPGDRILPEIQLKTQYRMSVTSVRRGMDMLVRRGILTRRRGSGTFVCEPPPASRPAARRDTILLCEGVQHTATHPFYGQVQQGIFARCGELGWRTRPMIPAGAFDPQEARSRFLSIGEGLLEELLASSSDIAGVLLHAVHKDYAGGIEARGIPCAALDTGWTCPYVAYDWPAESIRALALAFKAGARRLWIVSPYNGAEVARQIRCAAALSGTGRALRQVSHIRLPPDSVYSRVTNSAYEATKSRLAGGLPEAVVIQGDFEAQGVLDALAEAEIDPTRAPFMVAMVNKASQIHSHYPYTAFVADGYAVGEALAELLHAHIAQPRTAPAYIVKSCTVQGKRGRVAREM